MKILAFGNCPLDRFLGSGKTRLMWSEGLRLRGHAVKFVAPEDFEIAPCLGKGKKFRQAFGAWQALRKRRLDDIDLIEFYGDEFWLATRQLSRRSKRPFLVAHTDGLELLAAERSRATAATRPPAALLRRAISSVTHERFSPIAFAAADGFVTGCELDRKYVLERDIFTTNRAVVVPPGVDREFSESPSGELRTENIVCFGSWSERKGLQEIQTVVTAILKSRPGVNFEVLGASGSEAQIRAALPTELQTRITVHPRLSNAEIALRLARSRVLFFPSLYEGFGMALAEAMACGCAAVTTPTGFGAELLDGVEALICPFGDAAAMQAGIERLLDDDALRMRIATAGQRRARTLRWETSVAKLEETYQRWVEEFTRGPGKYPDAVVDS